MSNTERPRTKMKPCPYDGDTSRDSNGQCHCRNVLYRLTRTAATPADAETMTEVFNKTVKKKGKTVVDARIAARAAVTPKATKTKKVKEAVSKAKGKKEKPVVADEVEDTPVVSQPEPEWDESDVPSEEVSTEALAEWGEDLLGDESVADFDEEPADEEPADEEPADEEPAFVHETVETDSGYACACGFTGKGTVHSIRAHVSRERRSA